MASLLNSQAQGVSGKMNNLPKHHGAGPNAAPSVASAYGRPCLQFVRDIIRGVQYQRYDKRLEQQKGRRPNVHFCTTQKHLEEELYLNQYSIIVLI